MKNVILKWNYLPKNFFDNNIKFEQSDYLIIINDGIISLTIRDQRLFSEASHQNYNDIIESFFISRMLQKRGSYEIKKGEKIIEREDGHSEIIIELEPAKIEVSFSAEIRVIKKDSNGKIIFDSKENDEKVLYDLSAQISTLNKRHPILNKIFKSFKKSITDPENELVYLYEILDAVKVYFNGKEIALKKLKFTKKNWSELSKICNTLPLAQSRHRGQMINKQMMQDQRELDKAREISKKLILAFINFLDTPNN